MNKNKRVSYLLCCVIIFTLFYSCRNTSLLSSKAIPTATDYGNKLENPADNQQLTITKTIQEDINETVGPTRQIERFEPTMTFQELFNYVTQLSSNNGGCRFPCIWGLYPDENQNDKMDIFLNQYPNIDVYSSYFYTTEFSENKKMLSIGNWAENYILDAKFVYIYGEDNTYLYLTTTATETKSPAYWEDYDNSNMTKYFSGYLLPQVLKDYGKPTEVYIGPYPEDNYPERISKWIPFGIIVYYPENNFLINYFYPKEINGDYFGAYLHQINEFTVISWDSKEDISINDLLEDNKLSNLLGREIFNEYYKSIEEVMSIDDFYSKYIISGDSDYISIPTDLWPYK
jgi:hypothetical protein